MLPAENDDQDLIIEKEAGFIETLFERTEKYAKTSIELLKLKSADKSSEVGAELIARGALIYMVTFLLFSVSVGAALWLGDMLGADWYGFFLVAGIYALAVLALAVMHQKIKKKVRDRIITRVLN